MKNIEKFLKEKVWPYKTELALLLLGGAVCVLALENRRLRASVNNLGGQIENQRDTIDGLHKTIERQAFANGKQHRKLYKNEVRK